MKNVNDLFSSAAVAVQPGGNSVKKLGTAVPLGGTQELAHVISLQR